jgi:hypothetical protein
VGRPFLLLVALALAPVGSAKAAMPHPPGPPITVSADVAHCAPVAPGVLPVAGCADLDAGIIYASTRLAEEHERGHFFDVRVLTDQDRAWFTRLLGRYLPGTPWVWARGHQSPAERFADAYAACALGKSPRDDVWGTAYSYMPTARKHRRVCNAIALKGWLPVGG